MSHKYFSVFEVFDILGHTNKHAKPKLAFREHYSNIVLMYAKYVCVDNSEPPELGGGGGRGQGGPPVSQIQYSGVMSQRRGRTVIPPKFFTFRKPCLISLVD